MSAFVLPVTEGAVWGGLASPVLDIEPRFSEMVVDNASNAATSCFRRSRSASLFCDFFLASQLCPEDTSSA